MGCFVVDNAMELSGISPGIRELHQSPEIFFRRLAKNLSGDWKSLAFQSKRSTRSQTDTPPGGSSCVPPGSAVYRLRIFAVSAPFVVPMYNVHPCVLAGAAFPGVSKYAISSRTPQERTFPGGFCSLMRSCLAVSPVEGRQVFDYLTGDDHAGGGHGEGSGAGDVPALGTLAGRARRADAVRPA